MFIVCKNVDVIKTAIIKSGKKLKKLCPLYFCTLNFAHQAKIRAKNENYTTRQLCYVTEIIFAIDPATHISNSQL